MVIIPPMSFIGSGRRTRRLQADSGVSNEDPFVFYVFTWLAETREENRAVLPEFKLAEYDLRDTPSCSTIEVQHVPAQRLGCTIRESIPTVECGAFDARAVALEVAEQFRRLATEKDLPLIESSVRLDSVFLETRKGHRFPLDTSPLTSKAALDFRS